MMTKTTKVSLTLAAFVLCAGTVLAQAGPMFSPDANNVTPTASGPQPPITGTVTNKTTGRPSAGDSVVLIQLANGMQESTKTTTDARGRFSLAVPDGGMHLVRITHDKVPYFRPAPPGTTTADVDVYNGSAQVTGVHGAADVMRVQAQGSTAEVTELWAVQNDSSPPMTQFSAKAFEVWLPKGAEITGGAALGPNGMPVQASPVPQGDPGHYAFVFPLRPGETRFQLTYKVPYTGKLDFTPRLSLPFANLAVMLPKSMQFASQAGGVFQPVTDEVNAQVYLAKDVRPGQKLDFSVSGEGRMPADSQQGQQPEGGPAAEQNNGAVPAGAGAPDNRPGGGLGNPEGSPGPLDKYKWWLIGSIALIFVGGVWFAMRKPATAEERAAIATAAAVPSAVIATPHAGPTSAAARSSLLDVLKDELFRLETDRLEGRISAERYSEVKLALETVLRHALERDQSPAAVSSV